MHSYYHQSYPGLIVSNSMTERVDPSHFESHCHQSYELIYIWQGDGKYIVEGVEYPLHPHTLLLVRPQEYHYVSPKTDHPYERTVIHFTKGMLPELLRVHPLFTEAHSNYFPLTSPSHPLHAAFEALESAVSLAGGEPGGKTPEAEAFLHSTLSQILFLLTLQTPSAGISGESDLVLRVIEYLNAHLSEELSLDTLAREFFVSKYHLSRIFHAQTGAPIFTYFNTKRIALAREMLAEGENATTVALRLGYRDYSTFYRAFRKQTGGSPVRRNEK